MVFSQKALGLQPSPFDCWLITRGIKTLPLRLRQQMANAAALADQLAGHAKVNWVRYPTAVITPSTRLPANRWRAGGAIVTVSFNASQERDLCPLQTTALVHHGREPGRHRKPDLPPGHHDPRGGTGRGESQAGH